MLDHVTANVSDAEQAKDFYSRFYAAYVHDPDS